MKAKLKELRIEHGKTLAQIANALNLTTSAYAHYEQGIREPNVSTLINIANYFECSVDYLIGRENENGLVVISHTPKSQIEQLYELLNEQNQTMAMGYLTALLHKQQANG